MAVTTPMAFDYEIAAAINFMLKGEYDELIVDIPRGEDSLFFKGPDVKAIGEAKNVSKKHWTLEALFHSGKEIGPILQLWIRDREDAELVIFSSVGTTCPVEKRQLKPNPDDLRRVIDNTKSLVEVYDDDRFSYEGVTEFLKRLFFYEWPHRTIKSEIHKWCRDNDLSITEGGIERAIALFQDETYYSKKRILRSEITAELTAVRKIHPRITREYYTKVVAFSVPHSCYGRIAQRLNDILELYRREIKADWYNPTKNVNETALSVLKERIERLKDSQEECGSQEVEYVINYIERNPQILFQESKDGEKLRKVIRKLKGEFALLDSAL